MTREEAKRYAIKNHIADNFIGDDGIIMIDKIYDDFKSRTCKSCSVNGCEIYYILVGNMKDINNFGCNKWEPI